MANGIRQKKHINGGLKIQSAPKKTRQPAYTLLRRHFQEHISTGRWATNTRIPTESALANQYHVSRDTVRRALKELEKKGLLIAEQGSGRIVTQKVKNNVQHVRKGVIGMLATSSVSNKPGYYGYGDIPAIQEVLAEKNYDMLMYCVANHSEQILDSTVNNIPWNELDGLIIYCQQVLKEQVPEFNKMLPTVSMYHRCANFGIPSFYIAWNWVSYSASKHLFEQGYNNQLLLVSDRPYFMDVDSQLIEGVKFAHQEQSHPFGNDSIEMVSGNYHNGPKDVTKLIDFVKSKAQKGPLGIITYYTWPGLEIANNITSCLRIPEEVGVISLIQGRKDDEPMPLTTFEYDREQIGRSAVNRLINFIEGNSPGNILNLDNPFYGKLIVKKSTCIQKNAM